ncbi:hypothetical protein J437_LFUL011973 [Ladona fulva]|uniref:Uncharacterized protein n=1 Tax=Ladona fulva TaxID=123851 RepID=A0A8K0KD51_LADFU|nr:hypothetical protein J437_LFUL011973 [Ladona fulva]
MSTYRSYEKLLQYGIQLCKMWRPTPNNRMQERRGGPTYNCHENHPANYRGCVAFTTTKQAHQNRSRPTITPTPQSQFPSLPTTSCSQILTMPKPLQPQQIPQINPNLPPTSDSEDIISWKISIINTR